jgi:NTP pyrophosphatase (non-canonical NTP hydrolase)
MNGHKIFLTQILFRFASIEILILENVIGNFQVVFINMDISDIQKIIYEFQKKRTAEFGVELTSDLVFLHLTEELGEIARQLVNKKIPKFRSFDEENLKEEIVQSLLDLILLSKFFDIDLPSAIRNKINKLKQRRLENI